jgi:hypothetical protein
MPPRKTGHPKKPRGTDARQLIAALRDAGIAREDITTTADQHLQVRCPDGAVVTIPSDLSVSRTYANSRKELAAHGVSIPARGGTSARGGGGKQVRRPQARWFGRVTRWETGEPYGLVTTRDNITWFISRRLLDPGVADGLAFGRFGTFSGNPVPDLHKRYPHAMHIRLASPPAREGQSA